MAGAGKGVTHAGAGRPPTLFPLFAGLEILPGVGPKAAEAFAQMGVTRPRDLILTLPHSGIRRRRIARLAEARPPEIVTLVVRVERVGPPLAKGRPWRVFVSDGVSDLQLVFFHAHRDWIEKQLPAGARRLISGRLELFDGMAQMVHPDHIGPEASDPPPDFEPVYPLSGRLTQGVVQKAVHTALTRLPEVGEWIDPSVVAREGWPGWHQALAQAHAPQGMANLAPTDLARVRLAYDELFAHQLTLALLRRDRRRLPGIVTQGDGRLRARVLAGLPWPPTGAQDRAVAEIAADMAAPRRMNRLLQGDVGAGKTLVAFLALLNAVEAGGQGVLMAPTEILARQHFRALEPLARLAGIRLEALTGRDKGDARANILTDLAEGRIDILVGTHAVFQKTVAFHDLRLAIIDEQHRFGVNQRMELGSKGNGLPPDMLVMTATPIPRTIAMTVFGDLAVSTLRELPGGRKPIQSAVVPEFKPRWVARAWEKIREEVAAGHQAYVVCPRIEGEGGVLEMFAELASTEFAGLSVAFLHGRMSGEEKDAVMADFAAGGVDVLVSTTVIEVGVDVPNATVMMVRESEHFGVSQLHQLRGRVGRGGNQSLCLFHTLVEEHTPSFERVAQVAATSDGFALAELDLLNRREGDVLGKQQSGTHRTLRLLNLVEDFEVVRRAYDDAARLVADNLEFARAATADFVAEDFEYLDKS